jgi:hypothetical protein
MSPEPLLQRSFYCPTCLPDKPIKLSDIAEQDSETHLGGHLDTAQCSIGHFQPSKPQKRLLLCKAARYVARARIRILII